MEKIFLARIRSVLEKSQWDWEPASDRVWTMPVEGHDGKMAFTGQVAALAEDQVLVVLAIYPRAVPAERRDEALLFLNDLNYLQPVGSFEMDRSDGEVRFRVGFPIGTGAFDLAIFERLLDACYSGLGAQLRALDRLVGTEDTDEAGVTYDAEVTQPPEDPELD